jgi:hypothetical protein
MVGDTNIRPPDIVKHLSSHDDISVEQAAQLLDPLDKHNVPKAVALIQRLHNLQDLALPSSESEKSNLWQLTLTLIAPSAWRG